jgi:hypothetical protein
VVGFLNVGFRRARGWSVTQSSQQALPLLLAGDGGGSDTNTPSSVRATATLGGYVRSSSRKPASRKVRARGPCSYRLYRIVPVPAQVDECDAKFAVELSERVMRFANRSSAPRRCERGILRRDRPVDGEARPWQRRVRSSALGQARQLQAFLLSVVDRLIVWLCERDRRLCKSLV